MINNLVGISSNTGWHQCQLVYHITGFHYSLLVDEDGQAAEKNLSKYYGSSHHLLTKMTPVSSHQNKRHVTRSYVATPRVAACTAMFSDVMVQPALSVCPVALETTVFHLFQIPAFLVSQSRNFVSATPQPTSATTRFFLRQSPLSYCLAGCYQLFTVLLATRLP